MGPDLQRVTVAAWVNSRSLIAIGRSDGTVTVWPLPVGEGPDSLPGQGVAAVAWSKTGELAYAGWAGALARWSPRAGTQWLLPNIGGDRVTAMAWSDDGTQLAFGTVQGGVFSLSKDGPPQRLGEHPGGIASLTWLAEKRLAWAGWDGTVRVLEPDGSPSAVQPMPSDPRGPAVIAWDEDGHQLGIGGFDGAVAVWSAAEYRTVLPARSRAVRALAWSPRAPLLAAAHDGGVVQIWHETDRPHPLPIVAHQANVVSVAWSSDEEHLATAG